MEDEITLKDQEPGNMTEQVDVYVGMTFTKIYDIDTLNQRFQAEVIVESKWFDPSVKSINDDLGKLNWKPNLYIENVINEPKEEISLRVIRGENRLLVSEIRRVRGVFWENLELENFPCDVQDLSILISSKKSIQKVNLVSMQPEICFIKINHTLEKSMWHLHNVVKTKQEKIYREFSFGKREYSAIRVTCQAFRLPEYFYWNLILPILLITLAALGPFVIDYKLPQSRLPSTATMLLSSVSFKSSIARSLPTVSYLTSLDKYSLGSIAIITVMLLYHALISAFSSLLFSDPFIYFLDKAAFLLFALLIVSKNVIYFNWITKITKHQEMLRQEHLFHEHNGNMTSESQTKKD